MGKKKRQRKKIKKWILTDQGVSFDDIIHAGVSVLSDAAASGKKKKFKKAVKKGQGVVARDLPGLTELLYPEDDEPVIAYSHSGGGWYEVDVHGYVVDKVQGEEAAASRAGELLEQFASIEANEVSGDTGVKHTGGGWYQVLVHGVPVDTVQGEDAATERYEEIKALN